jgi:kynureninase
VRSIPPPLRAGELYASPNALAPHYSAFRVTDRVLLTGHSHQAWPDTGFDGHKRAWLDAAELVDAKWERVEEMSERVRAGFRALMGGCDGDLALDTNTHTLIVRLLSAMPLKERPRIVTTKGEFHSIRRQVDRLAEEGIEVSRVAVEPVGTLAGRVAAEVDDRTACVLISSVLFGSGRIVPDLPAVAAACDRHGAELLVDAYHSLGVVPLTLEGIERAFVVGGGYKYCQLGEGNCVLRIPPGCRLRPVVTGWFSEFAELAEGSRPGEVRYGTGHARFAGSTFEPTSRYRAAAVFDFFAERGLDVPLLREVSQHQVGLLAQRFQELDLDPAAVRLESQAPLEQRGGFLALRAPDARALSEELLTRNVHTDFRGDVLRLGPAPYVSDAQLEAAIDALGAVVRGRAASRSHG